MTHHLPHKPTIRTLTRAGSAGAVTAIAALSLALPANAQRPPEPYIEQAAIVVPAAPMSVPDDGLQIIQIGAGLLVGVGIGAAAVAARRSRRPAHQPHTA